MTDRPKPVPTECALAARQIMSVLTFWPVYGALKFTFCLVTILYRQHGQSRNSLILYVDFYPSLSLDLFFFLSFKIATSYWSSITHCFCRHSLLFLFLFLSFCILPFILTFLLKFIAFLYTAAVILYFISDLKIFPPFVCTLHFSIWHFFIYQFFFSFQYICRF